MTDHVISDTGPLIALAEIGQLELLYHLFAVVIIPPAVRAEVISQPAFAILQRARSEGWIREQPPEDTAAIRLLNETLDDETSAQKAARHQFIHQRCVVKPHSE